jgi:hypothetical protein
MALEEEARAKAQREERKRSRCNQRNALFSVSTACIFFASFFCSSLVLFLCAFASLREIFLPRLCTRHSSKALKQPTMPSCINATPNSGGRPSRDRSGADWSGPVLPAACLWRRERAIGASKTHFFKIPLTFYEGSTLSSSGRPRFVKLELHRFGDEAGALPPVHRCKQHSPLRTIIALM